MEHLDDLDNLEAKNVVNGRTGYDASSVNQSYLSEASGSPSYLSAIDEAPPSEYLHWRRRMVLIRRDSRRQAGSQAGDNSLVLKCNW